jgi:hypothetical protein
MVQRAQSSAPIITIPFTRPGFLGLNLQQRQAILGVEWATKIQNTVFDERGLISSRKGWTARNATTLGSAIQSIGQYLNSSGEWEFIATTTTSGFFTSTDEGANWTSVSYSAADATPRWSQFADVLLGFQEGAQPMVYDGTDVTQLAVTGGPTSRIGLCAFGRVWAKEGTSAIKYSALLDHTDWSGSDTGTIDLTSVWPLQDEITALAEFNNSLVIFSRRNIVIYNDNTGSVLGLDPTQMVVTDILSGWAARGTRPSPR